MATPHPDFTQLAARCSELANDAAKSWEGVGFRYAALKYAHSKDLLSGKGAEKAGGRINGIGTFPVIYTSADPQTATAEAYRNYEAFGFTRVRPMVAVGLAIKLAAVLDLTDAKLRSRLHVTLADLAHPWWPIQEKGKEALTQAIGRAAHDAGFEAVILPSARRKNGINVNVFPQRLRAGSSVAVLNEGDLKTHLK